jgi:hypothetical protein
MPFGDGGAIMLKRIRNWFRRYWYREGRTLSRFIAKDVRREILIVSASKIEEGVITGRVRTTNVLYVFSGLVPEPEFEPARELRINEMWHWTGQSWGGLPDGTSLAARRIAESQDAEQRVPPDCGGMT